MAVTNIQMHQPLPPMKVPQRSFNDSTPQTGPQADQLRMDTLRETHLGHLFDLPM